MKLTQQRRLIVILATMGVVAAALAFTLGRFTAAPVENNPAVAPDNVTGQTTTYEDGNFPTCFTPLPGSFENGRLTADFGGFRARYPGDDFTFAGLTFASQCDTGGAGKPYLRTFWVHKSTGWRFSVWQSSLVRDASLRRRPGYAQFVVDGYAFAISAMPSQASTSPYDQQFNEADPIMDQLIAQLGKGTANVVGVRNECFYRDVAKSWDDLASYGIGDPRKAMPEGIVPIQLDFTALERPASDCPSAPEPPNEGAFRFSAIFTDRYDNQLAILIHPLQPDNRPTATFQSGWTQWDNDKLYFNLNWRPGLISDDVAKQIALALDPGYGTVCTAVSRNITAEEFAALGFRQPVFPPGFAPQSPDTGRFRLTQPGTACGGGKLTGVYATWTAFSEELKGLVQVTVRSGLQDPANPAPSWDESRMIHWRDAQGVEYWVEGFKAVFPRTLLLEIARNLDPQFQESQLTAPASP